jgi:hypothetical protein
MDISVHASFLLGEDPPAAGQAHSNASFIARGRSSTGAEHEANSKDVAGGEEETDAEEMTTTHERQKPTWQRGERQ